MILTSIFPLTMSTWGVGMWFSFAAIGIGWFLVMACHIDNYRKGKDSPLHLIKNTVTATFTSVTVVVAINISFNMDIYFPDFTQLFDKTEIKLKDNGKLTKDLNTKIGVHDEKIDSLITNINNPFEAQNKQLMSEIRRLERLNGQLNTQLLNQEKRLDFLIRDNQQLSKRPISMPNLLIFMHRNGQLNNLTFDSLVQAKFDSYFKPNTTLDYECLDITFTVPEIENKTFRIFMEGGLQGQIQ